jgi:hypothetical protein
VRNPEVAPLNYNEVEAGKPPLSGPVATPPEARGLAHDRRLARSPTSLKKKAVHVALLDLLKGQMSLDLPHGSAGSSQHFCIDRLQMEAMGAGVDRPPAHDPATTHGVQVPAAPGAAPHLPPPRPRAARPPDPQRHVSASQPPHRTSAHFINHQHRARGKASGLSKTSRVSFSRRRRSILGFCTRKRSP